MAVGPHVLTRLTHCAEATSINLYLHRVFVLQGSTLGSRPLRLPFVAAELLEVPLLGKSALKVLASRVRHIQQV